MQEHRGSPVQETCRPCRVTQTVPVALASWHGKTSCMPSTGLCGFTAAEAASACSEEGLPAAPSGAKCW